MDVLWIYGSWKNNYGQAVSDEALDLLIQSARNGNIDPDDALNAFRQFKLARRAVKSVGASVKDLLDEYDGQRALRLDPLLAKHTHMAATQLWLQDARPPLGCRKR